MKTCGIVAEYNPFHNGHLYQMNKTRELGATHIVAVMSGNFVQRGEPAILSKFDRAEAAVRAGADLVLELPAPYAAASAERFAFGSVSILNAVGGIDMLSFGCECGDLALLKKAKDAVRDAKVLKRTKELSELGDSYPLARQKALEVFFPDVAGVVRAPNNTLAIEYLKALETLSSSIEPVAILRRGAAHDDEQTLESFASASYLRKQIPRGGDASLYAPPSSLDVINRARRTGRVSGGLYNCESAVLYKLRGMQRRDFAALPDCAGGLGDRLYAAAGQAGSVDELYELAKTKRYTMSRVKRAVLAAFLGFDAAIYETSPPYARILAIGRRGTDILANIDKASDIPVSHSLGILAQYGDAAERFAALEAFSTDVFNLTMAEYGPRGEDYTNRLVKYTGEPEL